MGQYQYSLTLILTLRTQDYFTLCHINSGHYVNGKIIASCRGSNCRAKSGELIRNIIFFDFFPYKFLWGFKPPKMDDSINGPKRTVQFSGPPMF